MYKVNDFECYSCSIVWEDLVKEGETSKCPKCESVGDKIKINTIKLGAFSMRSPEERKKELKRRSEEHTLKELRKEPERFGVEGIQRARKGQIKSFGGIK